MPNLEFWEAPQDPATLFCGKTSLEKTDLWDQKVIIKGMKFQEAYLGLLLRIVLLGNGNYVSFILLRSFVLLGNCNYVTNIHTVTYVTNILTLSIYLQ